MAGKWVRGKPPEKERVNFVVNREVDPEVHAFLMSIPYGRSGDYIRAILRAYVAEHGHKKPVGVQRDRKRAQPVRILYEPDEVVEPSEPVAPVPAPAPRVRPKPAQADPAPSPRSSVQESQSQPPASVAEKEKSSGGGSDQDWDAWSQLAGQFGL